MTWRCIISHSKSATVKATATGKGEREGCDVVVLNKVTRIMKHYATAIEKKRCWWEKIVE